MAWRSEDVPDQVEVLRSARRRRDSLAHGQDDGTPGWRFSSLGRTVAAREIHSLTGHELSVLTHALFQGVRLRSAERGRFGVS